MSKDFLPFTRPSIDEETIAGVVEVLRSGGGQAVITTTDADQVPGADESDVHRLQVHEGGAVSVLDGIDAVAAR